MKKYLYGVEKEAMPEKLCKHGLIGGQLTPHTQRPTSMSQASQKVQSEWTAKKPTAHPLCSLLSFPLPVLG